MSIPRDGRKRESVIIKMMATSKFPVKSVSHPVKNGEAILTLVSWIDIFGLHYGSVPPRYSF